MWGLRGKKKESGAGSPLEEAARQVVVPDPKPAEPEPASVEAGRPPLPSPLIIKPEWAHGTVKLVFAPACRWHHPAWCVTDEEAERATPAMRDFLQAVADRYVPEVLARFISEADQKHPELLALFYAMAGLTMLKYRQVSAAMAEEEAARSAPVIMPMRFGSADKLNEADVQCEVCGLWFESRARILLHLPCPGPQQPS